MKTVSTVLTFVVLLLAPVVRADSFSDGTNNLAQTNLAAAYADFASAVAANSTDAEANVYYAMTRVLMLPSLPAGSNFLTRLGLPATGRNIYDWTARLPHNSEGKLIIPSGLNAEEFTGQLRTNVLAALIAAQTNLAQITAANFTLYLPKDVTHLPDVTIDYGDVLMLRAMLESAQLYIYGTYSLNFDAQVTSVSNIIATDKSFEGLLTNFPNAFTFANTADKGLAEAAFTAAANDYFAASEFIRNRPPGETYLFNLSTNEQGKELKFRQILTNLLASVSGPPQPLPKATNILISMGALFSETNSPRQYLPTFQGDTFIWDSFTNVTLGGVVYGLTETNLDKALLKLINAYLETPGVTLTVYAPFTNDTDSPNGVIRARDGNLYGTTQYGGYNFSGTVFKLTSSGQLTTLHEFGADTNDPDGAGPNDLIQVINSDDTYLYGTTQYGGTNGAGTIFRIGTSGDGTFETLYTFGNAQDAYATGSMAALVQGTDGYLYGTTSSGGPGNGTVFGFSLSSGSVTNLHNFGGDDGSSPDSPLIQGSDGYLYGTTQYGGTNAIGAVGAIGAGTIFRISTNGNFTSLYSFGAVTNDVGQAVDGSSPNGLVQGADGSFYGTTQSGGSNNTQYGYPPGAGTLFSLSTSNQMFTVTTLYSFDQENQDGYNPIGSLVPAANGTFYGVTQNGGANGDGSIFAFNAGGAASSVVWFTKSTGENPQPSQGLTLGADGSLYGATAYGGTNHGDGTVYKLSINTSQAPIITTEPASQSVEVGGNVTLQVAASGSGTLGYQWRFDGARLANGTHVSGATTDALTLENVTTASAGSYEVIVTNSSGSATSTVATVTVLVPPSITTQPASQTEPLGGDATFTVKAAGGGLTYQWFFDGAPASNIGNISGSTTNQLIINLVTANNVGSYYVVVSNSAAATTSKVVQLTLGVEKTKPSVTIVSPKAGSRTNAPVLSGTASDSVRVLNVMYWLTNKNNGVITTNQGQATLTVGKGAVSNWTIPTALLLPGTNILAVQSSNYAGLGSPVESVAFFYQATTPFRLEVSPTNMGTVTGTASVKGGALPSNGASLYVGEAYTLTAKPANNWLLTNWLTNGTIAGTNATLGFIMESNLVVTANFASNLFVAMAGRYDGIFYPSFPQPATETNSGLIYDLALATNGFYSGKLYLASGTPYSFSGAFNNSGYATKTIDRTAAEGGNVTLELNIQWQSIPPRQITGLVQGTNWISTNLNLCAATTNIHNLSNYTALLPQDTNVADAPPNYGYALITNTGSLIKFGGALSDGTSFSDSTLFEPINEEDQFPVYASLYNHTGLLLGQLSLDAATNAVVPAGSLIWFKPAQKTGLYTNGFNTTLDVEGSPWTNSAVVLSNLFPTNAQLTLSREGLGSNLVWTVQLTSSNTLRVISGPTNFLSGSINRANGLLTVTFRLTGVRTNVTAYGTVLQNANLGGGFFPGATNAGTIILAP
jgi:uncharacterized repeat protein (TIGR03803 family)